MEKTQTNKGDLLFTPGPLNVSNEVRAAMNHDYGSRDPAFIKHISYIRENLLKLAHVDESTHSAVLIQGSGTFAVEAAIGNCVPRDTDKKLLVLINGAYGKRMMQIAKYYGIETLSVFHCNTHDDQLLDGME
jgi:2-aminoethylphosphonate-pyruvate transaminase